MTEADETDGLGDVYIRWGKRNCRNGSVMIYAGKVDRSNNFEHTGAAVDYLCLPPGPIYEVYDPKINDHAFVFGAVYDIVNIDIKGTLFDKSKYKAKEVPCAVCRPKHPSSVIMIPGRNTCYGGMTEEYKRYLMAGHPSHKEASEYICVDDEADPITPTQHSWKEMRYSVESVCGGTMDCPPYIDGAGMTCVVCTM